MPNIKMTMPVGGDRSKALQQFTKHHGPIQRNIKTPVKTPTNIGAKQTTQVKAPAPVKIVRRPTKTFVTRTPPPLYIP